MELSELASEKILYAKDVDARISELGEQISRINAAASKEVVDAILDELASDLLPWEEHAVLTDFRARVCGTGADWERFDGVSEDHWGEYAAGHAGDLYGRAATESGFWDDDKYALCLASEYLSASLGGVTFFFR